MDQSPRMDFVKFAAIADVWFLEDFWHVHLATKEPVQDSKIIQNCMLVSMENPTYPIRFTSANSQVMWLWNGEVTCPFGPALFEHVPSRVTRTEFHGFNPNSGLLSDTVRIDNGGYFVNWDRNARFDTDRPTSIKTAFSQVKRVKWDGATDELKNSLRTGWEAVKPAFHGAQMVRYYPFIQRLWEMAPFPRLERKSTEKPTAITDHDVFEDGTMGPTGTLQVTRVMMYRTYSWARRIRDTQTDSEIWPEDLDDYHRGDGPAKVTVYTVKDLITDSGTRTSVANDYQHEWYRAGKKMTGTEVHDWAKRNGVIMVDHPCHDRPCFPNEMDRAMWALT